MKILVINSGSSSLKYQLITTGNGEIITKGLVEKIGGDAQFSYNDCSGKKVEKAVQAKNHKEAIEDVMECLTDPANKFIKSLDDIEAVGHRVLHGKDEYSGSVLIDDKVIDCIDRFADIGPLHNPANLQGILACKEIMPNKAQVAVFDTAFHQSMPPESYLYALPYEYYEKYGVRKYGFHGTSHRYVTKRTAEFMGVEESSLNIITCHLGNGSSLAAVKDGKCFDTSMGFTPLDGLVMGTRCGTIDPAVVLYLMEKENLSTDDMNTIMNKKSGLLGVSGVSNDLREVVASAEKGDKRSKMAVDLLIESVRKYIGMYMVQLGRVDAIVFTAGIGENNAAVREACVAGLENFGIKLDKAKNEATRGEEAVLSNGDSKTKVLLIPTNEELMIALDTEAIMKS